MIRIRQYGESGELFDIKDFLYDIDSYFHINSWVVKVDWCQGDIPIEIKEGTGESVDFNDTEFRNLYKGVFQTIDGSFKLKSKGIVVINILAIDSSYWEIDSINKSFESYMLNKYGKYEK